MQSNHVVLFRLWTALLGKGTDTTNDASYMYTFHNLKVPVYGWGIADAPDVRIITTKEGGVVTLLYDFPAEQPYDVYFGIGI